MNPAMETIFVLLKFAIGLDSGSLGRSTLRAIVESQMRLEGFSQPELYASALASSAEQMQRLVEAVVVTESWFFREPEALRRLLEIAASRPAGPLRVLCLPCAGGEEAYSIAMALLEAGRQNFTITAYDISQTALAKASAGTYGSYAFRGRSPASLTSYLHPTGKQGQFKVSQQVRARVEFRQANVLQGLAEDPGGYDAVFCRNLLIYLTPEARTAVFHRLSRLLGPGGALFVAVCETATVPTSLFSASQVGAGFQSIAHPALSSRAPIAKAVVASPAPASSPLPAPLPATLPSPSPRTVVMTGPQDSAEQLSQARQKADQGQLDEAAQLCEMTLKSHPSSQGYLLLGAIRAAQGRHDAAQRMLRRAVYLDPKDAQALRHLAVYAERDGRRDVAQGLRQRAALSESRS